MKRIHDGIYSERFIEQHRGQKVIFYAAQQGSVWVDEKDKDGILIPLEHEWQSTDTAEVILCEGETVHTGRDGDFLLLKAEDCIIYLGDSLGAYVVRQF